MTSVPEKWWTEARITTVCVTFTVLWYFTLCGLLYWRLCKEYYGNDSTTDKNQPSTPSPSLKGNKVNNNKEVAIKDLEKGILPTPKASTQPGVNLKQQQQQQTKQSLPLNGQSPASVPPKQIVNNSTQAAAPIKANTITGASSPLAFVKVTKAQKVNNNMPTGAESSQQKSVNCQVKQPKGPPSKSRSRSSTRVTYSKESLSS